MAQEAESDSTRRALNPAAANQKNIVLIGRLARCVSLAGRGRAKAVRAKGAARLRTIWITDAARIYNWVFLSFALHATRNPLCVSNLSATRGSLESGTDKGCCRYDGFLRQWH